MRKIKLLTTLIIIIVLTIGCSSNTNTSLAEKDLAYSQKSEDNIEEEAINTLMSGSKYYKKSESMQEIKKKVVERLGDRYWPDTTITKDELEEEIGIDPDMYKDYMAEWQHTKTNLDRMIIIEANEDSVGAVELALNEYREEQLKKYENQLQNMSKVFASRIETIENYICYVQLGADTSAVAKNGEDEIITLCQEDNERAIDAIEKILLK